MNCVRLYKFGHFGAKQIFCKYKFYSYIVLDNTILVNKQNEGGKGLEIEVYWTTSPVWYPVGFQENVWSGIRPDVSQSPAGYHLRKIFEYLI